MAEIVIKLVNGELAGKTAQQINKEYGAAKLQVSKLEVGTKEWIAATQRLDKAKQMQADYTAQINATSKASGILKQQFGGILNQIPGFSQISGVLQSARGGVGGLTNGFGLLRGAIIATGIGALVIAVMALVGWFTKTEKGANMISGAFKGLGAVLDTLMSRLWNIGDTLKQLFNNPVEFFKNLGKDIKNAAVEGYDLVQVFDDIEDRQREMELSAKIAQNSIDQLMLKARNSLKPLQERIELLDKADKIERDSYQEQLKLSQEYLAAVQREVAAAEKTGTMGDELADKLKEAKMKVLDMEGQHIQIEEKIQNRRDQIIGKQEKANEKLAEQRAKLNEQEEREQAESLKRLEDMRVQAIENSELREIEAVNLKFQRELEGLTLQGEQRLEAEKLIEELRQREIQTIKDKYTAEAAEKDKKAKEEQEERDEQAKERKLQELEAIAEAEAQINAVRLDSTRSTTAALGDLISGQIKNEKAAKNMRRTFALADIAINLQQEMAANAAAGAKIAAQFPPATIPAGVAYTAAANVRSFIRAGFAAAKVVLYKRGGYVQGPSHTWGGVKGVVSSTGQPIEFEGGEFFFSGPAVRGIGVENLARLNGMFAAGGPINPFESGRSAAAASGQTGGSQGLPVDLSPLISEMQALRAEVKAWPTRLRVINDVTKTMEGIQAVNQLKDDANV